MLVQGSVAAVASGSQSKNTRKKIQVSILVFTLELVDPSNIVVIRGVG